MSAVSVKFVATTHGVSRGWHPVRPENCRRSSCWFVHTRSVSRFCFFVLFCNSSC